MMFAGLQIFNVWLLLELHISLRKSQQIFEFLTKSINRKHE